VKLEKLIAKAKIIFEPKYSDGCYNFSSKVKGDMSYVYDKCKHYDYQLNEIQDMILLDQVQQPNFVEYPEFKLQLNAISRLRWLTSGLSPMSGEVVAGSAISYMFNGEIKFNDIDIYFHSIEHANLWCKINNIRIPEYQFGLCGSVWCPQNIHYNLIVGVPFNNIKDLIAGFDIRACAIGWDPIENKILAVEGAVEDCKSKRIVFQTGARCLTVRRLVKYLEKGFSIDHNQKAIFVELIKLKPNRDQEILGGYR
jgi:hypothetical protein